MSHSPAAMPPKMTVDEFIVWMDQNGVRRAELMDGQPVEMMSQRAQHSRCKKRVDALFERRIGEAGFSCETLTDMQVPVSDHESHEPDNLIYCGERADDNAVTIPAPVVVVEIVSPSSVKKDMETKLDSYGRLASIQHYLVVLLEKRRIVWHRRLPDGGFHTQFLAEGPIDLSPPGIAVTVEELLGS